MTHVAYRTLPRRAAAATIDLALLGVPLGLAWLALLFGRASNGSLFTLWALLLLGPVLYRVTFHRLYGQTIGKMLVAVQVRDESGAPLGLVQALLREVPWALPVVTRFAMSLAQFLRTDASAPMTWLMLPSDLPGLHATIWSASISFGVADILVMLLHPERRSLRDLLVGSVVVRPRELARPRGTEVDAALHDAAAGPPARPAPGAHAGDV